ncbi:hypothetical protein ACTJJ4_07730 [Microbacterium sp. 22195]|uniref:hypothetical protein n=1 Tax=Microbacterium sp. 22195 TaxID=3453891 RepID=UPI003F860572
MGAYTEVWRDGSRLTLWMLYVITLLDADLFRMFGVHVLVSSAIRTYEEQKAIFLSRYVTAANVNGRRVYDTRIWNGIRWYRISSAGTVAVPGTSNHEIQGTKAAVDLRDTGRDAGITVATSARGRWIRQWCRDKGLLIASGDGFGEGWHFDVPGIFRIPPTTPAGSGGSASERENDMGTLDNTEENYQTFARWMQRAYFYDVRENGYGPKWELGRTVFELLRAADDSADVAKIGASVGEEIAKMNITLAGLGTVDLQIDTDKLAAELRAGLAPEIVKALGEKLAG